MRSGQSEEGPGLPAIVERLATFHDTPPGPPSADAFELVLFENVAYLAPDDRRIEAFEHLRTTIGLEPQAILEATDAQLEAVTAAGILEGTSAEKLRRCAEIAIRDFDGDLSAVVSGPVPAAKKALRRFPGIGEPGAEKILLFAAGHPFLAPDSNALRVLTRIGLIDGAGSYANTYAAAREVAKSLGTDPAAFRRARGLLRVHGRTTCRRSSPACSDCPLAAECAYAQSAGGA